VIRFHLARLIADRGFRERRRLELGEISEATGIHRSTLSRVLNRPGVNLTADNMSRLCAFFDCSLGELAEYVPDERPAPKKVPASRKTAGKTAPQKVSRRAAAQSS
jgi:putative transcriptional regulator